MTALSYVARAFNKQRDVQDQYEVISFCCSSMFADITFVGITVVEGGVSETVEIEFPDNSKMRFTKFLNSKTEKITTSLKAL